MPHYLVTGGAGFVGSHLTEALLTAGHKVTVLDNFSTGRRSNIPTNVEVVEGDIRDAALIRELIHGKDGIYHLAAIAAVTECTEQRYISHSINQSAWVQMLELVSKHAKHTASPPIPLVFISSAAVYGNHAVMPLDESMPTLPINAYGADKLAGELHARAIWHSHRVSVRCFRCFNIYGPRQVPGSAYSGVISIFMQAARDGKDLPIFGNGQQTRDFIFVKDIATILSQSMPVQADGFSLYNLCTGTPISINKLAETTQTISNKPCPIQNLPERSDDIRHSLGNATALKRDLGLEAKTSLDDGLSLTWRWFSS